MRWPCALPGPGRALQREVVGLGAAGREDDLAGLCVEPRGQPLMRLVEARPCRATELVGRAGVAERLGEVRQHRVEDLAAERGRRRVVEVDRHGLDRTPGASGGPRHAGRVRWRRSSMAGPVDGRWAGRDSSVIVVCSQTTDAARVAQETIVMFEPFTIVAIAGFVAFIAVIARLGSGGDDTDIAACSAGPAPSTAPRRPGERPSAVPLRRRRAPDGPRDRSGAQPWSVASPRSTARRRSSSRPAARRRSCCESRRLRSRIESGRHLDQLVVRDELDRGLQGDLARRRQPQRLVVGVGPDVGELLLLGRVDVHVARPAVLADDHPLVDLDAGADEQLRALLEVEQPVGVRRPGPVADQHAGRPVRDLAGPRAVALADLVQQRRAARLGQQLAAIADQPAHREHELEPDAAVGVGGHLLQAALAAGQRALDLADVVGRDVDGDPLVRLVDLAVDLAQEHLRPDDLQLEALAAHLLDQDRQLELAAAADLERVARLGRVDLDRDVAEDLVLEARLDLAARDVLALAARTAARC